jgi:hypothetical protein
LISSRAADASASGGEAAIEQSLSDRERAMLMGGACAKA